MTTSRATRKPTVKTKPADLVVERSTEPTLLPVSIKDSDVEPILTPCPTWCRKSHPASTLSTPTHWGRSVYARSSMMRGYYPAKADQAYAHLTLRLREPVDQRTHVMITQVWGDESGDIVARNEWELTIEEARNLIVALEQIVEESLT